MEGSLALIVSDLERGPLAEEEPHHLRVVAPHSPVEGSEAALLVTAVQELSPPEEGGAQPPPHLPLVPRLLEI